MIDNPRWWGWGDAGIGYPAEKTRQVLRYLQGELGFPQQAPSPPPRLEQARLEAPARAIVESLTEALGAERVQTGDLTRLAHCAGKSYRDLIRVRSSQLPPLPQAVVLPGSADEVAEVLKLAARLELAVVPFGGGTSVVGGVEGPSDRPFITLDLQHLKRCLDFDPVSRTATFEAGIFGPQLEAILRQRGFLLGHYPQSFEFSTLGGWVATRSAGQNSTRYGKIENMVQSLRATCPGGSYRSLHVPACASGPDLLRVMVGSEGTLGVITDATVRIHPLPSESLWQAVFFPEFEAAVEGLRQMVHSDLWPAVSRLSDPMETRFLLAIQTPGGWGPVDLLKRLVMGRLRGYPRGSLLILSWEGEHASSDARRAGAILARADGRSLGGGPARAWERSRFQMPYLRDDLLSERIMVEALETCTVWSNLIPLYWKLRNALEETLGTPARVCTHLSHLYPDGASLYVTFLVPQQVGAEMEQWRRAKDVAGAVISSMGATISHHHGVGVDHTPWLDAEHGAVGMGMLRALKQELDPQRLLNPGKLV